MCYCVVMNKKTPEQIDAIINEILALEVQRDDLYHAGLGLDAMEIDDKIVALIFDELKDDMDFEKYLYLKSL